MEKLINTSRIYIDDNIKRSSEYLFYKNPIRTLSPVTFADIIHRIYMMLYLCIDTENKNSKYNKYCNNFISNLSTKLLEELYIRCLKGKGEEIDEYIDYLAKVIRRLVQLKNDALMEVFGEFASSCTLFLDINYALMETPDVPMSPVKTITQAFKDLDNIDMVKYYIYETEILYSNITKIEIEDIKLVFGYLNIPVLYKLHHQNGEGCIKKKCGNNLAIITKDLAISTPSTSSTRSVGSSLSAFLGSLIKTPKTPSKLKTPSTGTPETPK